MATPNYGYEKRQKELAKKKKKEDKLRQKAERKLGLPADDEPEDGNSPVDPPAAADPDQNRPG
ncbi:MAG: hypothetical protein FGM55_08885 [Rhodoferax sp.]|nr:hypothetical protein [Rhodoferax sp.]